MAKRKGEIFTFKVNILNVFEEDGKEANIYRVIEARGERDLHSLAKSIVNSFDFQFDHAFGFYSDLKSTRDSSEKYELFFDILREEGEEEELKSEAEKGVKGVEGVAIDSVFSVGKKMLFLFDYGDDWRFVVECKSTSEPTPKRRYPVVVAYEGTPPEQYPDPDESDEDDDEGEDKDDDGEIEDSESFWATNELDLDLDDEDDEDDEDYESVEDESLINASGGMHRQLVTLAKPYGFCSGVERAVGVALGRLKDGRAYIVGDLMHSITFMKALAENGLVKVSSIEDIPNGKTVVIPAHGAPPEFEKECKNRGLKVADATCPTVKSVQNSISRNSKLSNNVVTIIIGSKNHPEIIGMAGYASNSKEVFVIETKADAMALPEISSDCSVFYYTQTTFNKYYVDEIIEALKEKIPQIKFGARSFCPSSCPNANICAAVNERQEMAMELSTKTDLLIVVGSPNSSNTTRLADIARDSGCEVVVVESELELETDSLISSLAKAKSIAIISGTSTPGEVVLKVFEKVSGL